MKKALKYSVTICGEQVSKSAPILLRGPLEEQFEIARELGYDGVELQLRNPEQLKAVDVVRYCKNTGLAVSAVATGLENTLNKLSLIDDDDAIRTRMVDVMKRHIDLAAEVDSQVIIGCVRGNIPANGDQKVYWQRFDDNVHLLAEYAAERNVDIVIEAINSYVNNYLNSVAETAGYLSRLGLKNVKLHIDTHHMNIEDDDYLDAVRQSEMHLGYVHFAGINRWYPAPGRIPYAAIQDELRRMDYDGFISLECVPVPDPYTASKRGIDYLNTI